MTQQTNGTPDLNYSKENFTKLYEALKRASLYIWARRGLQDERDESISHETDHLLKEIDKAIAEVEK